VESGWNLHRYAALVRYWSQEGPPVHMAAAAFLGLRKPRARPRDSLAGQDLINFLGAFPGGQAA
jgi:hypothetical protein